MAIGIHCSYLLRQEAQCLLVGPYVVKADVPVVPAGIRIEEHFFECLRDCTPPLIFHGKILADE